MHARAGRRRRGGGTGSRAGAPCGERPRPGSLRSAGQPGGLRPGPLGAAGAEAPLLRRAGRGLQNSAGAKAGAEATGPRRTGQGHAQAISRKEHRGQGPAHGQGPAQDQHHTPQFLTRPDPARQAEGPALCAGPATPDFGGGLQQTTSRSFSNWSLRAFRPSSGEERWALEALESVLQVSAQFDAPGAVTALLRAERAEARRACAEQLGLPLPSYRVHEDEQKDCQAKDWHFALSGPKGLCCAAVRPAGLFRFAQTLRQLAGEHSPANLPDFVLEDWPRFCWRGLQLDAVRHFMPVDFLKRYITALAHFKANFFHWHLTDDQSWRLFVRSRPALVNASRLTSPEFYSEQDVQEVLGFAARHFVTVVPVIETPGHALAALAAYPELACEGEHFEVPQSREGTYKDILCVGKAITFEFARDVFADVARLFPGRWIHIGGDETPTDKWMTSGHVRAFAGMAGLRNLGPDIMESWFCIVGKILKELGREPIMWDDHFAQRFAVSRQCPDARKEWIVQAWKIEYPVGTAGVVSPEFPFRTILSPTSSVYLDYPVASIDFNKSLEVLPDTGPRILGGCATMWTEDSEPEDVGAKVYPRFMAIAERFWGGIVPADARRQLDLPIRAAAHRRCERLAELGFECGRFELRSSGRAPLFHKARLSTSMDAFDGPFGAGRAVDGDLETYFWAISPKIGDFLDVAFSSEGYAQCYGKWLRRLVVKTGSKDRPSDQLEQGVLRVRQWVAEEGVTRRSTVVCRFQRGACEAKPQLLRQGPITHIRILSSSLQQKWMALPEIEAEEDKEPPAHPSMEEVQAAPRDKENEGFGYELMSRLGQFIHEVSSDDTRPPSTARPRRTTLHKKRNGTRKSARRNGTEDRMCAERSGSEPTAASKKEQPWRFRRPEARERKNHFHVFPMGDLCAGASHEMPEVYFLEDCEAFNYDSDIDDGKDEIVLHADGSATRHLMHNRSWTDGGGYSGKDSRESSGVGRWQKSDQKLSLTWTTPCGHKGDQPTEFRVTEQGIVYNCPYKQRLYKRVAARTLTKSAEAELRLEELLGTGSTAEVFRAGWHGTDVAVKKLRSAGQLSTEFKREISVLLRLRHPNLVLFMGACTKAPQALIISEFCAGGTVFGLLHQRRDLSLPWPQRLAVALDVAKGMNFLHRRQVVHRDLKSLNLLLAAPLRGDDVPAVKVSDFGLSRAFKPDQAQDLPKMLEWMVVKFVVCMTSGAGTYHWMAPEVLSGQGYDEKVDVYSYGICLFELITRRIPYEGSGLEPVSIAVAVSRGRRPDPKFVPQDCPADLRFTMKCCWAHRSGGRPGFDTILETLKLVKGRLTALRAPAECAIQNH
ncbi:unnamed protein product [Effrenium voratum]|nr:unnamed protein product [Effrenium voratum]